MPNSVKIAPSLLSADFSRLGEDIKMVEKGGAEVIHYDVMDGHFVPNLTIGPLVLKDIRKCTTLPIDVHLMIVNPDQFIKKFAEHGTEILTVHIEACDHLHRTVQAIHAEGMKAGVALNPHTNIDLLEDIIQDIDLVCLMSVNPGFGGQKFIENTYDKVKKLKKLIAEKNSKALIEIDGGVNAETAPKLLAAGADVLVAGSYVFGAKNPIKTIEELVGL